MKKLFSIILAMTMVFAMGVTVLADDPPAVPTDGWVDDFPGEYDVTVTTGSSGRPVIEITLSGYVDSTQAYDDDELLYDFEDLLDEDGRTKTSIMDGKFTFISLNMQNIIDTFAACGIDDNNDDVAFYQTNDALNLAYPGEFPGGIKNTVTDNSKWVKLSDLPSGESFNLIIPDTKIDSFITLLGYGGNNGGMAGKFDIEITNYTTFTKSSSPPPSDSSGSGGITAYDSGSSGSTKQTIGTTETGSASAGTATQTYATIALASAVEPAAGEAGGVGPAGETATAGGSGNASITCVIANWMLQKITVTAGQLTSAELKYGEDYWFLDGKIVFSEAITAALGGGGYQVKLEYANHIIALEA